VTPKFVTFWAPPLLFLLSACGGQQEAVEAPVSTEGPGDEIRRVAITWTSTEPTKGILSPPSPISVFHTTTRSVVALRRDDAREELTIWEELELRNGATIRCSNKFVHPLKVRYGRKRGEAAVEITRPVLRGQRSCDGAHPEPEFNVPSRVARFALRSDRLVAVEPVTDKRTYLPGI
jgi:hypothetical protein